MIHKRSDIILLSWPAKEVVKTAFTKRRKQQHNSILNIKRPLFMHTYHGFMIHKRSELAVTSRFKLEKWFLFSFNFLMLEPFLWKPVSDPLN